MPRRAAQIHLLPSALQPGGAPTRCCQRGIPEARGLQHPLGSAVDEPRVLVERQVEWRWLCEEGGNEGDGTNSGNGGDGGKGPAGEKTPPFIRREPGPAGEGSALGGALLILHWS